MDAFKDFPIFDEMKWVAAFRRGEMVPDIAVMEHPCLMGRMKDYGTPERVPASAHWRMKGTAGAAQRPV